MSAQLIQSYHIRLATPECHPNVDWYRAFIKLDTDISDVLPYLNAELDYADYDHTAKILLWANKNKRYAFRPNEIAIVPVESREEAKQLFSNIVTLVNDIWLRKKEIEPSFEGKKAPPSVLNIYKLLPKTNCGKCGFTCMAFAAVLRTDSTKLSLCPYLSEEDYAHLIS